jgi:hypothetical protein
MTVPNQNTRAQISDSVDKINDFNQDKIETIELIKKSLAETKSQLQDKEKQANEEKDEKQKIILENNLKRLRERYSKIKLNLVSVITDIRIDDIKKPEEVHKRDLLQEAQELLGPALDTIQRISAKPRKIEALKKELSTFQEKIALTDIALKNIETVTKSSDFKALVPDLESYIDEAKFNVNDLRQELTIKAERINRELTELKKDDRSMLDATTSLMKKFFSTKGKNLIITTIVFILTILGVNKLRFKILIPLTEKNPDKVFYKTFNALYGLLSFVSATSLSLLTLYLLGDWVLVTFFVLIITGTIWGFKDYVRKITAEGKLILNLGCVKEGDLIIYQNIPWQVKNINFITTFENIYLDTPLLRVSIAEILKMHARKVHPNEPWFPSKRGDWVMLSDGTFGEVKLQTTEQVTIEIGRTQTKYYPISQYLALTPINLSHGFTLDIIWGLDYLDQLTLLTTIIPSLETKLKVILGQYAYAPTDFTLDFHSAGASSLNINLIAKFKGDFAENRNIILKELQAILLSLCTEKNLNLPFNQMVVHLPEKAKGNPH